MDEYEDEFERRQCAYFLVAGDGKKVLKKAAALLKRNVAHAEFVNTLGVLCCNDGAVTMARLLFNIILEHDPDNMTAINNLAACREAG